MSWNLYELWNSISFKLDTQFYILVVYGVCFFCVCCHMYNKVNSSWDTYMKKWNIAVEDSQESCIKERCISLFLFFLLFFFKSSLCASTLERNFSKKAHSFASFASEFLLALLVPISLAPFFIFHRHNLSLCCVHA